jgi:diguanylate cyclase (GGDEF)-like protein
VTHEADLSFQPDVGSTRTESRPELTTRRPAFQVVMLAIGLLVAATVLIATTPDRDTSVVDAGTWAFVVVAALFGLFEYTVFNVQFRREGISFSLSEVPLGFALVFLPLWPAMLARLLLTVPVLVLARRQTTYKLLFNISSFIFETSLAFLIFRNLLELWGESSAVLISALVLSTLAVSVLTSVLISIAISRFEGETWQRISSELRATWWMYTVNSVLAAMTVGLALIEPALALFAVLPAAGMWHVLQSFGELGQELRDLDAVHGFAGRIGGTLDVEEIGDVAVDEVVRLTRGVGAALVRFSPDGPVVHSTGRVGVRLPSSPDDPGWRDLLAHGTVQNLDPGQLRRLGIDADPATPGLLISPVLDDGTTFAVLVVVDRDILARFDDDDVARVQHITEQLAVSLRRGMLHERIEFEARHDALTGLPGRTLFESLAADVVRNPPTDGVACVLMLDLDRFKEVNDTLGHHAGDDLLVQFSQRMSKLLEPDDVLARLAGDEFAILCHRASHEAAVEFARMCTRVGSQPVTLDGLEIVVTVSVGVAQITSVDVDALQPMRRADIAMYNAKWQRTGVEHYRDEIDRRTPARLSMLGDLRSAIEGDALDVVYQPKLDLLTGRIVGAEALVRWEHQSRGVVAPTEFVRVAEDTGLIKELTDLVLARGIAMLRRFDEHALDLGLAVNLSTHDLFDSRLPDRVRSYLEHNNVRADSLTLEITESSLFVDAPRTRSTIDELHDVGLRLAIDDFGTGYSSLSYLRRLPVHELKVDQSFVSGMLTDPHDEVIVRSTIDLGHNLGLRVVAEGVETVPVLTRLGEFGCDVAQGYGISAPMAGDDLIAWVARVESEWRKGADRGDAPTAWVANIATVG